MFTIDNDAMISLVDEIHSAISPNKECQGGIVMRPFIVASHRGPSGSEDLSAFIHAASAKGGWPIYWYGRHGQVPVGIQDDLFRA